MRLLRHTLLRAWSTKHNSLTGAAGAAAASTAVAVAGAAAAASAVLAGVARDSAVLVAGVAHLRPACSAYAFEFVCSGSTDIGANQCSRPAQRGENAAATD